MKNPWGRAGRYSGLPDTNGEKRNENLTVSTKKQEPGHRSNRWTVRLTGRKEKGKEQLWKEKVFVSIVFRN